MLTYIEIHFWYTFPIIGLLLLITRPFISRSEVFKIAFISTLAVVYTTPWDNFIIYSGAWTYPAERLLMTIGWAPIEEYMFFVIQSVLTILWTLICIRWSLPCFNFNHDQRSYLLIQWIPIVLLVIATIVGYVITIPGQGTFYLGCILWWVCPVIAFLWYGAGNFFIKKIVPCTVAIVIPTLYLCWIDQIALKENVWHISEVTSLNIFVAEALPLEEALFFFVSNLLVVLAVCAFDKSRGMMDTYSSDFPLTFNISWSFFIQLFRAFSTPEYAMTSDVTEDIRAIYGIINTASKTFNAASSFFPAGIRLDLTILYAFYRVTDNMINVEKDIKKKKLKYDIIKQFLDELFVDRNSNCEVEKKSYRVKINWDQYQSKLTDAEMASFRALSRINFYLPRKSFDKLLAGFQWDIEGRSIKSEEDLLLYTNYVAGSVSVLCVIVMMYRCDNFKLNSITVSNPVIEKVQKMGQVLQFINIARNIVIDSETLGRCYVPSQYMDDDKEELKILCDDKKPRSLGDKKLIKYSTRLIKLANSYETESLDAIRSLPNETKGSVLMAIEIYKSVSSVIQSNPKIYPTRASKSKWNKIFIGLYALYVKSIYYE